MSYHHHLIPEIFQDSRLFTLEVERKLPLRLALLGLASYADKAGRFRWKPQALDKLALPYDDVDFEKILSVLNDKGYIVCYHYEGRTYGAIAAPPKTRRRQIDALKPISP